MKKIRVKSAVPIYIAAAVWLLIGLIAPAMLLKMGTLILTALLSAAAYFVGSVIFKGEEIEVEEKANSGSAEIDRQIEEGRRTLRLLGKYNDQLPDPTVSAQLDRMVKAGEEVFALLEKDTSKATAVRRFMNYYLPTAEKIMANYVVLSQSGSTGENVRAAKQSVENSLGMIADAFEKQLDSLYRDRAFDMDAEITVLETVMKSEGLAGNRDFAAEKRSEPTGMKMGQ